MFKHQNKIKNESKFLYGRFSFSKIDLQKSQNSEKNYTNMPFDSLHLSYLLILKSFACQKIK